MKKITYVFLFLTGFCLSFIPGCQYVSNAIAEEMITEQMLSCLLDVEVSVVNADYDPETNEQVFYYTLASSNLNDFLYYGEVRFHKGKINQKEALTSAIERFRSDCVMSEKLNRMLQENGLTGYRVFMLSQTENASQFDIYTVFRTLPDISKLTGVISDFKNSENMEDIQLHILEVDHFDLIGNNLDVLGCFLPYYRTNNDLFYNEYMYEVITHEILLNFY